MAASIIKFEKPVTAELVTQEVIRPELNFEKMAQIWQPARSKVKLNTVLIERPNGAKVEMTANSKYGPPTTETQKVLYALYQISEEQGHPRGFYFSSNKIAKILKKKWGMNVQKIVDTGLYQLRGTLFVLNDAFYDGGKKKIIKKINTFNILSSLKMAKEEVDGHTTKEACYCEFNDYIYNNLINGHVKPLRFETLLSLGDDGIAQIFYTHLDLILSSGELSLGVYQRRSKELFQEFNLVGKEYLKINYRKKILEKIQDKLNEKPLSKGGVLKIEIKKTKDQQDYLLIANTVTQLPLKFDDPQPQAKAQPDPPRPPARQPKPAPTPVQAPGGTPTELVQYFHKKFFKLEGVEPQATELKQAASLIKHHGFDVARYIVTYAFQQARKTNFKVAVFGGIRQYAGRAQAQYQRVKEETLQDQDRQDRIRLCPLGCAATGGQVFWKQVDDDLGIIYQMPCEHDEAIHRKLETEQGIKISMTAQFAV